MHTPFHLAKKYLHLSKRFTNPSHPYPGGTFVFAVEAEDEPAIINNTKRLSNVFRRKLGAEVTLMDSDTGNTRVVSRGLLRKFWKIQRAPESFEEWLEMRDPISEHATPGKKKLIVLILAGHGHIVNGALRIVNEKLNFSLNATKIQQMLRDRDGADVLILIEACDGGHNGMTSLHQVQTTSPPDRKVETVAAGLGRIAVGDDKEDFFPRFAAELRKLGRKTVEEIFQAVYQPSIACAPGLYRRERGAESIVLQERR